MYCSFHKDSSVSGIVVSVHCLLVYIQFVNDHTRAIISTKRVEF